MHRPTHEDTCSSASPMPLTVIRIEHGSCSRLLPVLVSGASRLSLADKAVLSSPNLQMFLYYHFFYSLAYTWFFALSYRWKFLNFNGLRVNFFTPVFFTFWAIAEAARIYVGYQGNLKEDVSGSGRAEDE